MSVAVFAEGDTPELIVSAPVVDLVRFYLLARLPLIDATYSSVSIAENVPSPVTGFFVKLEAGADTGITDVIIDHWSLVVQCWGPANQRDKTERLSAYVAALIRDLEGRPLGDSFVYDAACPAFVHFPDPETRLPRWVGSARVACRALVV